MSDQHPVYSPPPDYSPTAPPGSYGADAFGAPPSAPPPPKKKTGLIIAIVVAVLLLCCCIGVAGTLVFLSTEESVTSSNDVEVTVDGDQARDDDADDPRLEEWLDWDPEASAMLAAPPASLEPFVAESLSVVAPQFTLEEAVWLAGEYDAANDWYWADSVYVRATHPSTSEVSAVVELWIQSDLMVSEDVSFDPEPEDVVTTIDGGSRELSYAPQWGPLGFQLMDDDEVELWKQIGADWPDAVVVSSRDESGQYVVEITKWEPYAVEGDYAYVAVTYEQDDGGEWTIVDWEYVEMGEDVSPT